MDTAAGLRDGRGEPRASSAKKEYLAAENRILKFDGLKHRRDPGRPFVLPDVEALVVRMAKENTGWGYDRIAGALTTLRGVGQSTSSLLTASGL
jgi:hypothetical protein